MRVPVTTALRAELSRAREKELEGPLALFILDLEDEGDLPAWEMAAALVPERMAHSSAEDHPSLVLGAAPIAQLSRTLARAGERELSAELLRRRNAGVPVVLLHDVVRMVKVLREVEREEAEFLLRERPAGQA
ncbi:MAG: hypothetical protein U0441_16960 [Polyangiaceae bacterium]